MMMDVWALARSRNITVLTEGVPADVKGVAFQRGDCWYIMVSPHLTREQQNFVMAHELAEIEFNEREDLSLDERHQLANHRAGEILLPEEEFGMAVHQHDLDMLKSHYPHCSYEVIARRTLAFIPRILTILDNGLQTTRIASENVQYPYDMTDPEQEAVAECVRRREKIEVAVDHENLGLTAHYIDQNRGFVRVILFTEIRDFM